MVAEAKRLDQTLPLNMLDKNPEQQGSKFAKFVAVQEDNQGEHFSIFFEGKTAFFRYLAEIRLRTLINHLKKQVLDPKRANSVPPAPCLKPQSVFRIVKTFSDC